MLRSDWITGAAGIGYVGGDVGCLFPAFWQVRGKAEEGGKKEKKRAGVVRCAMLGKPAPFGHKSQYQDSPYDLFCISHLATCVAKITGLKTRLKGYDALIDITRQLASSTSPRHQRDTILTVLCIAMPLWIPYMIRFLLRPSKFTWEFYALTTPLLFEWLVGPVEIKEVEVNGVMQKSMVHIKKCRFLETSNCVGMCVNMCKIPSEKFIKQEFGSDVAMIPNFEDMSCDMIFGQKPTPLEHDQAMSQPCYKALCMNAQGKDRDCPKVSQPSTLKNC